MTQSERTKAINTKLALKRYDEGDFDAAYSFAIKANQDDPAILRVIAFGYLFGNGTEVDLEKGQKFLSSAIEKGDIVALTELGVLYQDGNAGYNQDYEAAERIFREAAGKGSAFAAGQLGWMNYTGLLTGEPDYAKACQWFKIGVDGGDVNSIVNLAACYYDGTGVAQDYETALELYTQASEKNSNVALNMQGWMCEHGEGVDVDIERALDCYQSAADLGNEQSATNYDNLKKELGDTYKVLEDARAGDTQSQFDLANWYYHGEHDLPLDYRAARRWNEVAVDAGHVAAMFNLGWMLWEGKGGETDRKHAMELWRRSADKGYLESLNALGRAYQDEEFRDYGKALQCLRESADKGLVWSMNDLGNIYQEGVVVEQDSKVAYDWYLKSAMAGDAAAQWAVARMNELGEGVPVDLEVAEKWYLSAAEQGQVDSKEAYLRVRRRRMLEGANVSNPPVERKRTSAETRKENVRLAKEAAAKNDYITAFRYASNADPEDQDVQFVMGRCFHYGLGVDKNGEEAVKWLLKASEAGNPVAQAELAAMYHDGDVVEQDYAKAYELYHQSASLDCLAGIIGLGNLLVLGEGVHKNEELAMSLFEKAASMGSLECMIHLGRVYLDGSIVPKDIALSCKYYEMAAEKGDVGSHEQLGYIYGSQQHGILNYEESFRHHLYAAEHGNAIAMFNLGVMYENGEGVEKDDDVAVDWYTKSAKAGYANAIAVLKRKSNSNQLFLADKRLNMPYKAFISYRRSGGREYARVLYLELRYRGIKTFFDYTSLQHGDFSADILRAIEEAPNFIMVVTDGAFDRCVDENDWVRKEIEYAKKLGKNIVPVAPTGHQQDLSALPDNLADVRRRQVFRLDMENLFEESVGKIVKECLQDI